MGPADERLVSKYVMALDQTLAVYDVILQKQAYLAGDDITLADIFHLSLGKLLELEYPKLFDRYPNVKKWLEELSRRPSWIRVNPDGIGLPANRSMACSLRPIS